MRICGASARLPAPDILPLLAPGHNPIPESRQRNGEGSRLSFPVA